MLLFSPQKNLHNTEKKEQAESARSQFTIFKSSLKQQSADRHVATLGHIIPIPSQPVFAPSP
jgi:hypothetical protein